MKANLKVTMEFFDNKMVVYHNDEKLYDVEFDTMTDDDIEGLILLEDTLSIYARELLGIEDDCDEDYEEDI